jgi:hypothetical protein
LRIYIKPADANGENPKVIQELRRPANLKVTMDTNVQAVTDDKGKAQSKVVGLPQPAFTRKQFMDALGRAAKLHGELSD